MKHSRDIDPLSVLRALESVGVRASVRQSEQLAHHARLVLDANEHLNLTRIVDPDDIVWLHIVDSLAYIPLVGPLSGNVVDIGSGAGYPGIPLSVMGYTVTLCESVRKKAQFLAEAAAELGLRCPVAPVRAEELAVEKPGAYETVVVRAVSSLSALVELSTPLLKREGRLVALKARLEAIEVQHALVAAETCGMRLVQDVPYTLPRGEERRAFTFQRVAEPRIRLPRRPGMAQRRPLGGEGT